MTGMIGKLYQPICLPASAVYLFKTINSVIQIAVSVVWCLVGKIASVLPGGEYSAVSINTELCCAQL